MSFVKAKKDITVYKQFKENGESPVQDFDWGVLRKNRVLRADNFDEESGICMPGVHAFTSKRYATTRGFDIDVNYIIWECVIPKGTRYYLADTCEARTSYDDKCTSRIVRSPIIKLIREIGEIR